MLNNEPAQLDLFKKLQEATTSDVDEERGSFKKGDRITYNMLGGGLTDSDLIRTLGTNEHATRANHNGTLAEIVEAIGEKVARYSIMFEDGFVINDVAASELKTVSEATESYTITWQNLDEPHGKFRFLDVDAHSKLHAETKAIETLKRDGIPEEFIEIKAVELKEVGESKTNEAEEGELKFGDRVRDDKGNTAIIRKTTDETGDPDHVQVRYDDTGNRVTVHISRVEKIPESKTNEAEDATDTMKPQEKPNIKAEDYHMEDYSEDDLEKVKSKSAETGNAIRQVDDKELVIEPDKTVEPKKESKLKEETEFTPSRAEASKITDEKLKELHKNALRSLKYWEKDGTAPEKVESTRKAVARYEEMLVDRGVMSKGDSSEKKESKFSFMKKQEPLWLCNECYRTFRSDKNFCENCKSENVEKITEQYGPGFTKEVFQVTWKNTDTGKEESTRVMAFDKADAKKEAKRSNREIIKVEGPITEEPKNEDMIHEVPGVYKVIFYDEHEVEVDAVSKVDAMAKARKSHPEEKRVTTVDLIKQKGEERDVKDSKEEAKAPFDSGQEGSKLHETVRELVGEVSGIDKDEQKILIQAIEKDDISNMWPSDETMIDKLTADPAASKIHSPEDIDGLDMGEIRFAYLKYILLPKAKKTAEVASESKMDEQEVEGVPGKGQTYSIHPTSGVSFPDGNYEVTNVSYRWTVKGDLAKHFQVVGDDRWWIAKFYGFKEITSESKINEEEDWELSFMYSHNLIWHNPLVDHEGNYFHFQRQNIAGKRVRVFTNYQMEWVVRNKAIPVKVEYEPIPEAKEIEPITAIEIVRSKIDPEAYNIRVVELPEGSIVVLDSVSDSEEAIKRGKEFARQLNAKFLGIIDEKKVEEEKLYVRPHSGGEKFRVNYPKDIERYEELVGEYGDFDPETHVMVARWNPVVKEFDKPHPISKETFSTWELEESKLKEQEEDTFTTVAKGITDKADADKLAKEKEGQVIQDEEDRTKFAVLVRIER